VGAGGVLVPLPLLRGERNRFGQPGVASSASTTRRNHRQHAVDVGDHVVARNLPRLP
jgi:hypothetical protein